MRRALRGRATPQGSETPPGKLVKLLSALALTGFAYFSATIVALHVLCPEYDPTTETVSQYAIGPYGYLMTAGFLGLSPAVFALALGLWRSVTPRPWLGSLLLSTAGFCIFLVGVFPIDPRPGAMPTTETTHDAAFMASFVFTVAAMVVLTRHFGRDAMWRSIQPVSLTLSLIVVVGLAAFVVLSDTSWRGAAQRVCIITVLLWLLLGTARLMFFGLERRQQQSVSHNLRSWAPQFTSGQVASDKTPGTDDP